MDVDEKTGVVIFFDLEALLEDLDVELLLIDIRWNTRFDMSPTHSMRLVERHWSVR